MLGYAVRWSALCLFSAVALAQAPLQPGPDFEPEGVVQIQLQALQRNDDPAPDAGIEQTWAFAHPDNRAATGPLERFAAMIRSPAYAPLLNHRHHSIEQVVENESVVVFLVTVVSAAGPVLDYRWVVKRVDSGDMAGAWMTSAVSAPARIGDVI